MCNEDIQGRYTIKMSEFIYSLKTCSNLIKKLNQTLTKFGPSQFKKRLFSSSENSENFGRFTNPPKFDENYRLLNIE